MGSATTETRGTRFVSMPLEHRSGLSLCIGTLQCYDAAVDLHRRVARESHRSGPSAPLDMFHSKLGVRGRPS